MTQMTELNQKILEQNNQLKGISRTMAEAEAIQNNTLGALDRQREKITDNI